ncbi:NAD-dependent epimerase/dehydratase family protein [Hydrogenophaga sp.]|uniref:NAD-dependent epimerase/dehydratase family protein n=1 Tax=Hydrogenophaga sp. TaxID=1904254 RepID=UPI0035B00E7D
MKVLVTGGLGFLGSHLCLLMSQKGMTPVAMDMWDEGTRHHLNGLNTLLGHPTRFVEGWSGDPELLRRVLGAERFDAVVHLEPGVAIARPGDSLDTRIAQTLDPMACLLNEMENQGVLQLHVASSAEVYAGSIDRRPLTEQSVRMPSSPRGVHHIILEELVRELPLLDAAWRVGVYRFFSLAGGHESGLLGPLDARELQQLLPQLCKTATDGLATSIRCDLPTEDGSGVHDFIHVEDAAAAIVAGLQTANTYGDSFTVNVGTGMATSELDMVKRMGHTTLRELAWSRRFGAPGAAPCLVADMSYAHEVLGWRARKSVQEICDTTWAWFLTNQTRVQAT